MLDLYRHYKGGVYALLHMYILNTETNELMVLYQDIKTKKLYVRNHSEFFGPVFKEEQQIWRFEKITDKI